jgi:PKD repeat protein
MPTHSYSALGTYTVTLTVMDNDGVSSSDTCTVEIVNRAPVAEAGDTQYAFRFEQISFDGSGSNDPDGTVVSYYWDFGDGTADGYDVNPSHIYSERGMYVVTLTVTDNGGATAADTTKVYVENNPPVAEAGEDQIAYRGTEVTFDGSGSIDIDGTIVLYEWDFGEYPPMPVVKDKDGNYPPDPDYGCGMVVSHTYSKMAVRTVTLTVTDDDGSYSQDTCLVRIINHPPEAEAGADQTVQLDQSVTFDGTGSTDPDGEIVSYDWDFGDGQSCGYGPGPVYTYSELGTFTVTLTVTDNDGKAATDTMTVTVYNNPPVAEAGSDVTIYLGTGITFDGTGSYDPDGTVAYYDWDFGDGHSYGTGASPYYVYTEHGVFTVTLTVTDNNGATAEDSCTITVLDNPPVANAGFDITIHLGTAITFDSAGSGDVDGSIIGYDWDFGDGTSHGSGASPTHTYLNHGVYTVTLMVTDDDVATAEDTCTVTVLDNPPEANAGPDKTIYLGTEITFDGTGSSDVDGSIAGYEWDFGDGTAHGSGASPSHTYANHGVYTVTLKVTDDDGSTAEDTCTVTVLNNPPVARAGADLTLIVDETGSFDGSGSTDIDGSVASYDWDWGDGSAHGTGAKPTHSYSSAGVYTVTLTVADDDGSTASATLAVTVRTPAGAADDLVVTVQDMDLDSTIETPLVQKLQNAITDLNKGNTNGAAGKLDAFINQVEAKRGKGLTDQQADELIAYAEWILDNL